MITTKITMATKKDIRKIAEEKRSFIYKWLSKKNELTNKEIIEKIKFNFGSGIDVKTIAEIRHTLGINTKRYKKSKITKEDVIVMQKNNDIPEDVMDVIQHTIEYMREIGIKHLELDEDGSVKITLTQTIETLV